MESLELLQAIMEYSACMSQLLDMMEEQQLEDYLKFIKYILM